MFQARRRFNPREDVHLKRLVDQYGTRDWKLISKKMKNRTAKQCRDRYLNYLASPFKCSEWTTEEDDRLLDLVREFGTQWNVISLQIPDRAPNHLKNRWHKVLLRRMQEGSRQRLFDDSTPMDLGVAGLSIDLSDFDDFFSDFREEKPEEERRDAGENNLTGTICPSTLTCNS